MDLIFLKSRQSSANSFIDEVMLSPISLMYIRNINGPSTVPYGTPESTCTVSDASPDSIHYNPLRSCCKPCLYPSFCLVSHPIMIYFVQQSLVWYRVEGFGEIKYQHVNLITIIQGPRYFLHGDYQLGFCWVLLSEAVLVVFKQLVWVYVVHDRMEDDMLHKFGWYTSEWHIVLCTINCFLQWDHLPNMAVGDLAFYYTMGRTAKAVRPVISGKLYREKSISFYTQHWAALVW